MESEEVAANKELPPPDQPGPPLIERADAGEGADLNRSGDLEANTKSVKVDEAVFLKYDDLNHVAKLHIQEDEQVAQATRRKMEKVSLKEIAKRSLASAEETDQVESESGRKQEVYMHSTNGKNVFSIDYREFDYHLGPAMVFYINDMSLDLDMLRLVQQMESKKEAYDWLENLTSTVSHEMRTPLSGIMQMSQRVSRVIDLSSNPELSRLMMMIFYQAQLMLGFVNDLLDLKQLKHGVYQQIVTVFDPNEILELIKNMFVFQAESQSVEIRLMSEQVYRPSNKKNKTRLLISE